MPPVGRLSPDNFYREWLRRSFDAALVIAGVDQRRDIMRTILLWAVACLALFFIPWHYIPIIGIQTEDLPHEMRLALSAIAAVILVFVLSFLYQLVRQPSIMCRELWQNGIEMERIVAEIANTERDKTVLSELHASGLVLYRSFVNQDDPDGIDRWKSDMDKWVEEVRAHISDRSGISTLHEFNDLSKKGGLSISRSKDGLGRDDHGFNITALYSGYLASVDHIIRYNGRDHFGERRLFDAKMKDLMQSARNDRGLARSQ
jgi:hypothetical protein